MCHAQSIPNWKKSPSGTSENIIDIALGFRRNAAIQQVVPTRSKNVHEYVNWINIHNHVYTYTYIHILHYYIFIQSQIENQILKNQQADN